MTHFKFFVWYLFCKIRSGSILDKEMCSIELERASWDELTEIEEGFEIRPPFLLRPIVEHMHGDERLQHNKCQDFFQVGRQNIH